VAAVHARYADVAVMTRPSEGSGVELREEIIEGVFFHSGRPALIAPPGWKGGRRRQTRRGGLGREP
jgi:hypothetical protein